jgi:ligand-binding sensor domain-containing protein
MYSAHKVKDPIMRITFLQVILMICSISFAQHPGWTVYANKTEIIALALDGKDVWIGTRFGLEKIDKISGITTFYNTSNSGLQDNEIQSIAIDAGGNKWVGTEYGGLAKFDGATWTIYSSTNSSLPENDITSIKMDNSRNVWIGTLSGDLVKFDGISWTAYSLNYDIISIAIDGTGAKWIGTNGGGVAKFDDATWIVFSSSNSDLPYNWVSSIAIDSNGSKWIGTGAGLAKFDGTEWSVYTTMNSGLPYDGCGPIVIDESGNKWIGTAFKGLAKFDGTEWTSYDTSNSGLPNNQISSISIDDSGNVWIGTGYGLAVFSGGNSAIKMNHRAPIKPFTPLCSNYPNPFKQKTLINYNVLENGPVSLRIYMLDGHLVQTLVNAKQTIGQYSVSWDGKNDKGKIVAHGVYLYQLRSNSGIISKRMNFVE